MEHPNVELLIYWMLPKIPTYTFINFQEIFPPIRLFSPIFLLVFEEISHLYFYSDSSSIRNSRVGKLCMIFFCSFVYRLENQLEWGLLLKLLTWQQLLLQLQALQNLQLWPTGLKNQKRLYLILIHLVPWKTYVMWQKKIILCKWIY